MRRLRLYVFCLRAACVYMRLRVRVSVCIYVRMRVRMYMCMYV